MPIKVKKDFEKTVVGFNNSGLPLGERKDLHLLLNDVIGEGDEVRNDHIAAMFEELPTKQELLDLVAADHAKKAGKVKVAEQNRVVGPAPATK